MTNTLALTIFNQTVSLTNYKAWLIASVILTLIAGSVAVIMSLVARYYLRR